MVVVLPWHDPVRVAEGVSMLDNLSGGRVILGIGRGLGRVEFEGFRVAMDEVARTVRRERARSCSKGSRQGVWSTTATTTSRPRASSVRRRSSRFGTAPTRPAVSPGVGARSWPSSRTGILIVPQKPWEQVVEELERVSRPRTARRAAPSRRRRRARDGCSATPTLAGPAKLGEQYVGRYYETVIDHYEFTSDHLATTRGYEYYGRLSGYLDKHGTAPAIKAFTDLHVIGTPKQCIDKIEDIRRMVGNDMFMGVCAYGDMAPRGVRAQPAALRLRRDAGGQAAELTVTVRPMPSSAADRATRSS